MSPEAVLKKVRALRELARSSNVHEAEAAAARADELIQKHRLSEAEIGDASAPEEAIGEDGTPLDTFAGRIQAWKTQLGNELAKHYGCYVYAFRQREWGIVSLPIVGRPSDVAIVRYMYAWLVAEIVRLAYIENGQRARNAFSMGAVVGLALALRRSRRATDSQHTAAHGSAAALVLASRAEESERWTKTAHKLGGKTGGSLGSDPAAFARGIAKGRNLHVGAALGEGAVRALPGGQS